MPTTLSPKQNFQLFQKAHAEELQKIRESGALTVSMTYALAEMANLGGTTEQMNGARNFIHVLQNLWEKTEPAKRLPVSRLETYEMSPEELAKKAKEAK
jgi:hypothetical protein